MKSKVSALSLTGLLSSVALTALAAACGGEAPTPQTAVTVTPPSSPATTAAAPPAPAATTPDADFRKEAPKAGPEVTFVPPKIVEGRLKNGIRVLLVERHDLPIVAVHIASDRGADQAKTPGLGSFVAGMLSGGTKTRSALELSDAWDSIGGSYSTFGDFDAVGVNGQVLASKLDAGLELLADMFQSSAFPVDELDRMRTRRLSSLAQEKDNPNATLSRQVVGTLYGATHVYGTPLLGTEDALKKLTSADLQRFHGDFLRPDHTVVAVAGDVTRADLMAKLEKLLGTWGGKAKGRVTPPAPAAPKAGASRLVLVDRPGATQSHVALCDMGPPRVSKDYDALVVMNTILGGQFSSRLNLNLREKHAYTYGAGTHFDFRRGNGPFSTYGAIVRESTVPAIREIFAEVKRIRTDLVSAEELEAAKAYLIRQLPARFETTDATAATILRLPISDLPLDEFATRPARIAKITAEDVKRVARAYLRPETLRLVVLGDAQVVREGLEAFGKEEGLGALAVRPTVAPAGAGSSPSLTKGEKDAKSSGSPSAPPK